MFYPFIGALWVFASGWPWIRPGAKVSADDTTEISGASPKLAVLDQRRSALCVKFPLD
jgi:hypothetical protein